MTHEQLGQWLNALKSGYYTQLQGHLVDYYGSSTGKRYQHCCLGVLAEEFKCRDSCGNLQYPVEYIADDSTLYDLVVTLNDTDKPDQYQRVVADIESAMEDYLTEPEWK